MASNMLAASKLSVFLEELGIAADFLEEHQSSLCETVRRAREMLEHRVEAPCEFQIREYLNPTHYTFQTSLEVSPGLMEREIEITATINGVVYDMTALITEMTVRA